MGSTGTGQYRATPGGPRTEVYPSLAFGVVNETIAAGSSALLKFKISGTLVPASSDWIVSAQSVVSWCLKPNTAAGATLEVLTAPDETNFSTHRVFPLFGNSYNSEMPFYLPAWKCRFRVLNASGALQVVVTGHIKIQGV